MLEFLLISSDSDILTPDLDSYQHRYSNSIDGSNGNQPFPVAGGSYSYSQPTVLLEQTDMQFQDQFNYTLSPTNSPSNVYSTMSMNPSIAAGMRPTSERSSFGDIAVTQAEPMAFPIDYGTNSQSSISPYQSGRQGMNSMNGGAPNYPSYPIMSPIQHQPVSPPLISAPPPLQPLPPQQTQYSMPTIYPTRYPQFSSSSSSSNTTNTISTNPLSFSNPESSFPDPFTSDMESFAQPQGSCDYSLNQFLPISAKPALERFSEPARKVPSIPPHRSSREILSFAKQEKPQRHCIARTQSSEPLNPKRETEKDSPSDWQIKSTLVGPLSDE